MHLMVAAVMATTAMCGDDASVCKNVVMDFELVNNSDAPARMFSGYESNEFQVGSDNCVDTSLFEVAPHATRTTSYTESCCVGEPDGFRVVGVVAGPVGAVCETFTATIPSNGPLISQNIKVTATWDGMLSVVYGPRTTP